jgi:hypothetical protein
MDIKLFLPIGFRDRREQRMCIQRAIIVLIAFLWLTAISLGEVANDLNEHAQSIMKGQWWLIGGLFAVIQILLLTFYAYSQSANARANRAIMDRMDKMDAKHEKKEELILDTRRILLELHGEHKVMMDRCAQVNSMSKKHHEES